jgi:uncharacterized membrane protein
MNQGAVAAATNETQDVGLTPNMMSGLSYFCGIVAIVALCVDPFKKDPKVRFNAVQSLLFQGTWFVAYVCLAIVSAIAAAILGTLLSALKLYTLSVFLLGIFPIVSMLFTLAMLGVYIYLIIGGATGKTPSLPVLSAYARKFSKM